MIIWKWTWQTSPTVPEKVSTLRWFQPQHKGHGVQQETVKSWTWSLVSCLPTLWTSCRNVAKSGHQLFKCANLCQSVKISVTEENIARIANAVQCHNLLSNNKDCHEFRFSIVRIVNSVSNVKIPRIVQKHENLPKIWKSSKNLKIFQKSENLPKILNPPKI